MRLVALFICLLLPLITLAQSNNAGFVQGLWYDQEQLFAEEPVRIYAAVRNNTGAEMSGTVTFYINDEILTRKSVSALDGRIVESWADWTPTYGERSIRAELSRLEISFVDGEEERITVTAPLAEDLVFVDVDTDGDGVGNIEDEDDDNDGVSDEDELKAGTDPLVADQEAETEAEETDEDEAQVEKDTDQEQTTSRRQGASDGIEQYLTPSRAETLLSGITDWTNERKEQLDDYREARSYEQAVANNDPDVAVDENGFGEVLRSTGSTEVAEPPEGWFGDFVRLIGTIITSLYTAVLAILSWTLSYPMLIQLLVLLGLLYLIYRIARRYGGRPR